jgi:hypothetical protein
MYQAIALAQEVLPATIVLGANDQRRWNIRTYTTLISSYAHQRGT